MRRTKRPAEVMHRSQQLPEPLQHTGETSTQIERTHNGGTSKRGVNADTIPGERDVAKGTSVAQRSSKRIELRVCTVWFAACRSVDCSPIAPWYQRHQPGTVFPYTGCSAKIRIKLRNRILWRTRDRFSASFKSLIRTALIKILPIGAREKERFLIRSLLLRFKFRQNISVFNAFEYLFQCSFIYKCLFTAWKRMTNLILFCNISHNNKKVKVHLRDRI